MIITEENYIQLAMSHYENCQLNSVEEFQSDLNRINNIQKLLKKFTKTGGINGRLLINHFIILTNVFDGFAPKLMHHMIDSTFHPQLDSLLFVFSYTDNTREINLDESLVQILREIIK